MKSFAPLLFALASVATAAIAPEQLQNVRALLRDRQVAAAESAVDALVRAHPAEPEAHALLSSVRMAKSDVEGAVAASEKAAQLAPASSEMQRQLGDAYGFAAQKAGVLSKMSWAKKCRTAYEKAVELDPGNISARKSLMAFCQMAPAMVGGGMDKAYAQANAIKSINAMEGHLACATLQVGEKKYGQAFAELDAALVIAPDSYSVLYQIGRVTALSGEHIERGMAALQKCLAVSPPPGTPGHEAVHWRLGNLWEKQGNPTAARDAYQAALALNPKFQPALDSLKNLK